MATQFKDESWAKEEVKNIVYLLFNKHILDRRAQEIVVDYQQYLLKEDIPLYLYVETHYTLDSFC